MNVLYVGFTRAEERMYILTGKPSSKPENMGTVSDMLAFYYQQKGEWEQNKTVYSFGTSVQRKPETSDLKLPTSTFQLTTSL